MTRAIIIADTHCGHFTGLTPPRYQVKPLENSVRNKYIGAAAALWKWFADNIQKARRDGPFDLCIMNGDAIDGRGERSGSTELIVVDRNEQCQMAADVLKFIDAKEVRMTYGTGYHTGKEEDFEAIVAEKAGVEHPHNELHLDINGCIIDAKHTMGNTKSVVSIYTALQGEFMRHKEWAFAGQQPFCDILIRSHIHRALIARDPGTGCTLISTPSLQGLGDKFGARAYGGLPVSFGFLVLNIEGKKKYSVQEHIAPLKMQAAHVEKIS